MTLLFGCTPTQYAWQDTREPARENASADLETCRKFAAKQYQPGMPAGEEYLNYTNEEMMDEDNAKSGEWRPDRSPFKKVNVNALPVHDVPVDYTGYPGELDYHPHYLDDILEKCMHDKGWDYQPVIGEGEAASNR